ncbi:type II secretion system GspH family protein [Patescibacteria group bacterium]|nr:type II secretion system GspH family protein [Patescibacteria group bacterium]
MKLHKASSGNTVRAFSMIEVIVVIGILSVILGTGAVFMTDAIGRSVALNEQNLIATLLMGQRTKALSNINQTSHGLKVEAAQYTLFEGVSFVAGTNKRSIAKGAGVTTGGDTEFVFGQLSGTSTAAAMAVTDGAKTATISVNTEGRVEW